MDRSIGLVHVQSAFICLQFLINLKNNWLFVCIDVSFVRLDVLLNKYLRTDGTRYQISSFTMKLK